MIPPNLTPQEKAAIAEAEKYRKQVELMRQLYTFLGFYNYWYERLPLFTTRKECFEDANTLHYELFGAYRYSDYDSFMTQRKRQLKKTLS